MRGKELTIRPSEAIHAALLQVAEAYRTTMNAIVTEALIEHLEKKFGITVRPVCHHGATTLVETTCHHRATTVPPQRDHGATTVPPKGDIGEDPVVISSPSKKKTKKERDPFAAEMIDLAKQHGMLGTRQERVDKWVKDNKPDDSTKQRIREAVGEFYRTMSPGDRNYNKIGAVFEGEKWNDWKPAKTLAAAPIPTVNPHSPGHPLWLKTDLAMGKTSADYDPRTQRHEWSRHKLWETQGKDAYSGYAQ